MGLFSSKKSDERKKNAEKLTKLAGQEAQKAREAAQKKKGFQKSLESGKSNDPAADRYMIREEETNRRIAAANAKGLRKTAEFERKRWF